MSELNLKFDVKFEDLYSTSGLSKLDGKFIDYLKNANVDLHNQLVSVRRDNDSMDKKDTSNLLIEVAPYLEDFIGELFSIEGEVKALQQRHGDIADLYSCKRLFVQRRALKICKAKDIFRMNIF